MHSKDIKILFYFIFDSILQSFKVLRGISKNLRNASTNNHHLESLSILRSFLLLIPSTIIILFFFALTFPIFLTLLFAIPGLILLLRWITILVTDNSNTGDMKVPTFYSTRQDGSDLAFVFYMSVVGVVFRGIHCAGWFFTFPSSDEAKLCQIGGSVPRFLLVLPFYHLRSFPSY